MVLMLLDHTKDVIVAAAFDPLDADVTNLPGYLTRWITHFCAPTFCFLMGIGAYLAGRGKRSRNSLGFCLPAGCGWCFSKSRSSSSRFSSTSRSTYHRSGVLVARLVLVFVSALVFLPSRVVGAIGVVMILTHNLLDGINAEIFGPLRPLWLILHERA